MQPAFAGACWEGSSRAAGSQPPAGRRSSYRARRLLDGPELSQPPLEPGFGHDTLFSPSCSRGLAERPVQGRQIQGDESGSNYAYHHSLPGALRGISDPRAFCVVTGTCCIDAELLTLPCPRL